MTAGLLGALVLWHRTRPAPPRDQRPTGRTSQSPEPRAQSPEHVSVVPLTSPKRSPAGTAPPRLGHLERSKGDFSSYGAEARAARALHKGRLAEQAGQLEEAAEHYRQSARLWPVFANTHKAAQLFLEAGALDDALRLGENQLERARRETGHQSAEAANAHSDLATIERAMGLLDRAEKNARAALWIDRTTGRETAPAHIGHLAVLAVVLDARGDPDAAEEVLRQAITTGREICPRKDPALARAAGHLADLLMRENRTGDVDALVRLTLAAKGTGTTPNRDYPGHLERAARWQTLRGQTRTAARTRARARTEARRILGEIHPLAQPPDDTDHP